MLTDTDSSRPTAVEEHSSLVVTWTVLSSASGLVIEESIGETVRRFDLPDLAAAEILIAERQAEMEQRAL